MKTTLKILSLLTVLAVVAPRVTFAEEKAPAKTEAGKDKAKAKEKVTPLYAQVESITDTLLTVKGGTETKFVINAETKITKDKAHKEAATVADVKPDQWIGGSYSKAADGSNVLHSLHLAVDQTGGKKKADKKEKAK